MLAGLLVLAAAWIVPVNLKSLTPALLKAAGEGTPTPASLGRQLLDREKAGAAALTLAAARALGEPLAPALATALDKAAQRQPELVPWGGWDPFLDPLFKLKENTGRTASTPVLTFFITEKARSNLAAYLANSRSQGVQTLLRVRDVSRADRFVPAKQPGGQTLDAVVLLTALLYQGEHLPAALQRELRDLAETAANTDHLGALEPVFVDLLSLGKRLDWIQLTELMRVTGGTKTIGEFAQLARATPDDLPILYTAALLDGSADRVATLRTPRTRRCETRALVRPRGGRAVARAAGPRQPPAVARVRAVHAGGAAVSETGAGREVSGVSAGSILHFSRSGESAL
jgi:hypothetical protein